MRFKSTTESNPAAPMLPAQDERNGFPWLGIVWLLGFFIIFFSFTLPNNRDYSRTQLVLQTPVLLLDLIDPTPRQGDPPSGWQFLPQRLDLLLTAGVILAGAWGLGHFILRLIGPPLPKRCLERTVFAFGLGLSGLSLLTLGCGLAERLSRNLFGTVIAGCVLLECGLRLVEKIRSPSTGGTLRTAPEERPRGRREISMHSLLRCLCLAAMSFFVIAMLFGAMSPPVDFDVREYHLQGPKEFFQNGRIDFLPHNVYTSFPFLTEMLSLLGMVLRDDWFRGALAGKVVLMCFAPLTALAVFVAGRRWFGSTAGWLAATIHLTTPWTYRISIIAYAEGGLTFYLCAGLLAVMIGIEKSAGSGPSLRMFLLAGLLAGSGMACKYPGLVSVVIPLGGAVLAVSFAVKRVDGRAARMAVRSISAFAAGVLLAIGPWLVKNAAETGNPVYPLAYAVFGGADRDAQLDAKWRGGHSPATYSPVDLGVKLVDVTANNDWLSPLLYGLAPLALLVTVNRRTCRWLWLYVGFLFVSWWVLTHRIDRFWVPMIPVVSLLAGIGAVWNSHKLWKIVCGTAIVSAVLFNFALSTTSLGGYNAWLTDLPAARKQAAKTGIRLLNESLPPDSKVLCVGEAEVFDAEFPLVYNTVFDKSIFEEWCSANEPGIPAGEQILRPSDEIRKQLKAHGITHLYVNWGEVQRYRQTYGYTEFVTRERFRQLQEAKVLGKPEPVQVVEEPDEMESLGDSAGSEKERAGSTRGIVMTELYPVLE